MIHIKVFGGHLHNKFTVRGHSLFEEKGRDIVCSAVSSLSIMTSNYLELKSSLKTVLRDGLLEVEIIKPSLETNQIINIYIQMIKELIKQYPNYIRLKFLKE